MAVSSIAVPRDPKRDARARELVASVATWPTFTLKQPFGSFEVGAQFRQATGSKGARYLVNAVACECPDYQAAQNVCKHIRAVVLFEERQAVPVPRIMRQRYEDLFPSCQGCGDIAEGKDGLCYRCASEREWQQRRESQRREFVHGRHSTDVIPLNIPE